MGKNKLTQILFLLGLMFAIQAGFCLAQPSAAQIKSSFKNPKIVSLDYKKGSRVWSSGYKKYVWDVPYTVKIKTDEKGIYLIVRGIISFDIVGSRYVYWREFVTDNSYEGIPSPTKTDVDGLIQMFGLPKVMGDYHFRQMIGQVESIQLADEPKYEWHTMNSVSFNIVAIYTKKGNGINAPNQRGRQIFRVRIYRDNTRAEWKNIISETKEWTAI